MQTILGSSGIIGVELAKSLPNHTDKIRLVSRNPKIVNGTDEIFPCDLTNIDQVKKALEGSDVAYLTVGLDYNLKVWEEFWPKIMANAIEGCKFNDCKLVFFDNVYMYDEDQLHHMTEDTVINPPSKKGKVRAEIAETLMNAWEKGEIMGMIARAPDFYGPGNSKSMLMTSVYDNFKQGKKANWLGSVDFKHSFIYTPDAGKATAMLGNSETSYNQVWHLPTAPDPLTGKEWIEIFAREMDVKPKYQIAGETMAGILGLFNPLMKELAEMIYQYDREYVFDSSKFEHYFSFRPTSYANGIDSIVRPAK
ncbi:MAG: NAD-dependent epimerase/dehydratase family protein [Bacteroidetes bacterium]|nr:NAD-dependent epimerase/dehydratase family protein [Bacteroidota bacterium]MDA1119651.1 NAD-dependent epimerase/dehydratase family protein [Bacteroidota bacterium]